LNPGGDRGERQLPVSAALRRALEAALGRAAPAFSRCVLLAPELDDTAPALGAAAWAARRLREL
jgi:hypothetical protein